MTSGKCWWKTSPEPRQAARDVYLEHPTSDHQPYVQSRVLGDNMTDFLAAAVVLVVFTHGSGVLVTTCAARLLRAFIGRAKQPPGVQRELQLMLDRMTELSRRQADSLPPALLPVGIDPPGVGVSTPLINAHAISDRRCATNACRRGSVMTDRLR